MTENWLITTHNAQRSTVQLTPIYLKIAVILHLLLFVLQRKRLFQTEVVCYKFSFSGHQFAQKSHQLNFNPTQLQK